MYHFSTVSPLWESRPTPADLPMARSRSTAGFQHSEDLIKIRIGVAACLLEELSVGADYGSHPLPKGVRLRHEIRRKDSDTLIRVYQRFVPPSQVSQTDGLVVERHRQIGL